MTLKLYIHLSVLTYNLDLSVLTLKKGYTMSKGIKTKDKTFSMRTDPVFRDNLTWLSNELGLNKAESVEIAVNLFPELVKLYSKLDQQVKAIKDNL
jgi:hypothetical protein